MCLLWAIFIFLDIYRGENILWIREYFFICLSVFFSVFPWDNFRSSLIIIQNPGTKPVISAVNYVFGADFSIWRDSSLNCRHVISPSVYHGCTTEPGETLLVSEKLWEFKERMLKSKDIFYWYLARLAGFEPATYGLEVRCSIQLSYRRNVIIHIHFKNL